MDTHSIGLGILFSLIWSSAFTSAKIVVEFSPPFLALGVRFMIAGIIGLLIVRVSGQSIRLNLTKRDWFAIISFGICQNTLYLGLNFFAMKKIDASIAVVIASMLPLIVAVFSSIIKLEKLNKSAILGLTLGAIGVFFVMLNKANSGSDPIGLLLCFFAVISLAIATLIAKYSLTKNDNTLAIISFQMLIGSIPLLFISTLTETWIVYWCIELILAFIYTTFVPGLLATFIWFKLVKKIGATKSSSFHFMNPILGVIIAAIVLSEK